MRIDTLIKKIRLEIVANDYDLPGGMKKLAEDTGLKTVEISKTLHGHYKPKHRLEIAQKLYQFFKEGH